MTDTPVSGCRWGVTLYDRYPAAGVSVGNVQKVRILQATTDTYDLKGGDIFFRTDTSICPTVAFASRPRRDFFLPNTNSRVGLHDILLWGDKPPFVATDAIIPRRSTKVFYKLQKGFLQNAERLLINCRKTFCETDKGNFSIAGLQ